MKLIKKVKLSEKSEIRLTRDVWNDKEWISFRLWTLTKAGWKPTTRGVNLELEFAEPFFGHLMKGEN